MNLNNKRKTELEYIHCMLKLWDAELLTDMDVCLKIMDLLWRENSSITEQ